MSGSPIHIVSSFHYDVLYLKDYDAYLEQGIEIIDRALGILESDPDYKFTVEQVLLVREYCRLRPERVETMRKFAREERLCFAPGMFVMPDMNMIDGESLFRQIKRGKEFLREMFGVEPECCWIADCWGHHAQLPQILRQSGYTGYFFWRCMRRDVAVTDFLWRGIDGTRITAHWLARGYSGIHFGSGDGPDNRLEQELSDGTRDAVRKLAGELREHGDNGAVLICNGGDFCLPQPAAPEIVRTMKDETVFFSTPAHYLRAIPADALSVFGGEFNASFQGSYSTNIRIKQLLYRQRERLLALESCAATRGDDFTEVDAGWETVLTHQFHDTICGTVTDAALERACRELSALDALLPEDDMLYNPASRSCREAVDAPDGTRRLAELKPFECKKVSDLSLLPKWEAAAPATEFSNAFYTVRFGERGFIASCRTPSGRELVNSDSPAPFGSLVMQNDNGDSWLLYEGPLDGGGRAAAFEANDPDPLEREPGGLVNCKTFYPAIEKVEFFRAGGDLRIVQRGVLAFWRNRVEFTVQTEFRKDSSLIRYTAEILPSGRHYRLRAAFPAAFSIGRVIHDIPFGCQERGRSEYTAQSFCDYATEDAALTLFNRGIPGNNVDSGGVMLLSLFRSVAMEYKTESVKSYSENVPHRFEYAIMPRDGGAIMPIPAAAELYSRPPCPVPEGAARYDFTGIELPANVRISALRRSSGALFLRLCETCGVPASLRLKLPVEFRAWCETDGLEQPVSEFRLLDGPLELVLKPFEILNLSIADGG